ncbi:MAG: hypothetical protein HY748_04115 [Elusimicrobia bacterium]|nr:hypothetical protein [Elusimicrobiota bacterium]
MVQEGLSDGGGESVRGEMRICMPGGWLRLWRALILASAVIPSWQGLLSAQDETVCAVVKLEIKQEATLEREAFDARLLLNNNSTTQPLQNLFVNFTITDIDGNPADILFFVKISSLSNTNAIDGTGVVQSSSTADIHWLIIPSTGAGGSNPLGLRYAIRANISYTANGIPQLLSTFDAFITVKPQPSTKLEYVLPYEVFSDEPLTVEIEPIEPFPLGVRVTNVGYGTARNFQIDSAQPRIVENKQGLAVDFKLLGTVVAGNTIPDTLLVPFGDVAPGGVGQASWIMSTTLSGRFIEFTSTFTHAAELGGALTSLIQSVTTYTLLKDVLVDLPGRDRVPDFLVNMGQPRGEGMQALLDSGGTIAAEYILESDQPTPIQVTEVPAAVSGTLAGTNASLTLSFAQPVGSNVWAHSSVPVVLPAGVSLVFVTRSDGKALNPANGWISKHFRKSDRSVLRRLNVIDLTSSATAYVFNFSAAGLEQAPGAVADLAAATGQRGGELALSWTAPGEDGQTGAILGGRYLIQHEVDQSASFAPAAALVVFATSTAPGRIERYVLTGAIGNTTNYLRLWTQDTGGAMSGISNGATAYALPNPPAQSAFVAVSSEALGVSWVIGNNSLPIEYQVVVNTDLAEPFVSSSPFFGSFQNSFTFAGLAPNTAYTLFGFARNPETGARSEMAVLGSTTTLATPPVAQPFADLSTNSLTAAWAIGSNPAGTEYWVELSTLPERAPVIAQSGWIRAGSFTFSGLASATTYYARAKARNLGLVETGFTDLGAAWTSSADNMPPRTGLVVGLPRFGAAPVFVTDKTTFSFTVADDLETVGDGAGLGAAYTMVSVDTAPFFNFAAAFSLVEPGMHTIRYYSVDYLNNVETERQAAVVVDAIAPATSLEVLGSSRVVGGMIELFEGSNITLTASDPEPVGVGSGVGRTIFLIDTAPENCIGGAPAWPPDPSFPQGSCRNPVFTAPFALSKGTHTVLYYSVDHVGNTEVPGSIALSVSRPPGDITETGRVDFRFSFGGQGSAPGQFNFMSDVSVDQEGNVYAADSGNARIQKFNPAGGFLLAWGSYGSGPGQFSGLWAINVCAGFAEQRVVAVDNPNRRVQIFTSTGGLLGQIGPGIGGSTFTLSYPVGVACDGAGHVYIGDQGLRLILKTDQTGRLLGSWSIPEGGIGRIAVDMSGMVYVSVGRAVFKFTADGTLLQRFGDPNSTLGNLSRSQGMAFDIFNNLYVGDSCTGGQGVQVFAPSGTFLAKFGEPGTAPGQFLSYVVQGVGIDRWTGRIFATDTSENRVEVFDVAVPTTDIKAPLTKLLVLGPSGATGDGNLIVTTTTLLSFESVDSAHPGIAPSGVAFTEYRLDETGPFQRFTTPFALEFVVAGFPYRGIEYRSTDHAGNVEPARLVHVYLDFTPPRSALFFDENQVTQMFGPESIALPGDLAFPETEFTIVAHDPGNPFSAGVGTVTAALDGMPVELERKPETSPCPEPLHGWDCVRLDVPGQERPLAEGLHLLTWQSGDKTGNFDIPRTVSFNVVRRPPNVVNNPAHKFLTALQSPEPDGFFGLTDLAVDFFGNVYVANLGPYKATIWRFSSDGALLQQFPIDAQGMDVGVSPVRLAINPTLDRKLLVTAGYHVGFYTTEGSVQYFPSTFGGFSFVNASDAAFDSAGNIYVADSAQGKIFKFSPSLEFIMAFGERGGGQFVTGPGRLASDRNGHIFATDTNPGRILKFSSAGEFIGSISGPMAEPDGLSTDIYGNVLVADRSLNVIHLFSSTGALVGQIGSPGSGQGQLASPRGLDIHLQRGRVYVADRANQRVQIFAPDLLPDTVMNLHATATMEGEVLLSWTAPGEDGGTGQAASYELRYSTMPITNISEYLEASTVTTPSPGPAGSTETLRIAGLAGNTSFYFALRAFDSAGNPSALSNTAVVRTPFIVRSAAMINGNPELLMIASNIEPAVVLIDTTSSAGGFVLAAASSQTLELASNLYDVGPPGAEFSPLASLTLRYSTKTLADLGLAEAQLGIYRFHPPADLVKVPGQTLDMQGRFLRVPIGRVTSIFGIFGPIPDRTPPLTSLRVIGGGRFVDTEARLLVSSDAALGFDAFDPVVRGTASGVAFTEFRVDAAAATAPYSVFVSTFGLAEGGHLIEFRSQDHAGNLEVTRSSQVFVDAVAPATSLLVNGTAVGAAEAVIISTDILSFASQDAGSGVSETLFKIDEMPEQVYASTFTLAAGTHTVTFRSRDNVGNVESLKTALVSSLAPDTTAPSLAFVPVDGSTLATSRPTIAALYSDEGRGIDLTSVRLALDGLDVTSQAVVTTSSGSFVPAASLAQGSHTINASVTDMAGNLAAAAATFMLDVTPPSVVIESPNGGEVYLAGASTIQVRFGVTDNVDPAPGFYASLVQLEDRGSPRGNRPGFVPATTGQTFDPLDLDDGLWRLKVSAADFVMNSTAHYSGAFEVIHDTLAPRTLMTISAPQAPGGPGGAEFVSSRTMINLSSVDDLVLAGDGQGLGVAWQALSVDGIFRTTFTNLSPASRQVFSSSFTLATEPDGIHALAFFGQDVVGHVEALGSKAVALDDTPPLTGLVLSTPSFNGFVSSRTLLTLVAEDPVAGGVASGVEFTSYRIGGGDFVRMPLSLSLAGPDGAYVLEFQSRDRVENLEVLHSTTVLLDQTPPETTLSLEGPVSGDFVTSQATVALVSHDPGTLPSGAALTRYKINDGAFVIGSPLSQFGLSGSDGNYRIQYQSEDHVANLEVLLERVLKLDNTPPKTEAVIQDTVFFGVDGSTYASHAAGLGLIAVDAGSEVERTEAAVDGEPFEPYSAPLTLAEGVHVVRYRSVDKLGNVETERSLSLKVDGTPPTTTAQVGEPSFMDAQGKHYVTPATAVSFSALDPGLAFSTVPGSGLSLIEVAMDTGPFSAFTRSLTFTEGRHTVFFRAVDRVGNVEVIRTLSLRSDATPPITAMKPSGEFFTAGARDFAPGHFTYSLPAEDPAAKDVASGVAWTRFGLDHGPLAAFTSAFSLTEGIRLVSFQSQDNVENLELLKNSTVYVDATAPATALAIGGPSFDPGEGRPVFVALKTMLGLPSIDPEVLGAASGVREARFRLDSGAFQIFAARFTVPLPEGPHQIEWFGTDNVGNAEVLKSTAIALDDTAPLTSLAVLAGRQARAPEPESFFASSDTALAFVSTDPAAGWPASGLGLTEFQDNAGPFEAFSAAFSLTEGVHRLGYRSRDRVDNLEVLASTTVLVDATPPVSILAIGTPQAKVVPGQGHGPMGLTIVSSIAPLVVISTDPVSREVNSGLEQVHVSTGFGFSTSTAAFRLDGVDGIKTVSFYAFDRVGNTEAFQTGEVGLDNTAPLTSLAYVGGRQFRTQDKVFASTTTAYRFDAGDPVAGGIAAGVDFTEFSIDSGPLSRFAFDFTLAEGVRTIAWRSQDRVANLETLVSTAVHADATPPISSTTLTGPRFLSAGQAGTVGGPLFIASSTLVGLRSEDPMSNGVASGLNRIMAALDGGTTSVFWLDSPIVAEGTHTLVYQGFDNVENAETSRVFKVSVDSTPPVTDISFLGVASFLPGLPEQARVFIASGTRVALAAQDPVSRNTASGVLLTRYRIGQGLGGHPGPWTATQGPFLLPGEGLHLVEWQSQDKVENLEQAKVMLIAVDQTPPETSVSFGEPGFRGFGFDLIASDTPITLTSQDPLSSGVASGAAEITYRADGGPLQVYVSSFTLPQGMHTLEYGAVDRAQNAETRKTVGVAVADFVLGAVAGVDGISGSGTSDITGLVQSNGNVDLSGNVAVVGDVTAYSVTLKGQATVSGNIIQGASPLVAESIDLALIEQLAQASSSNILIPESFLKNGALSISGQKTLTLSTGVYVVEGLEINGGASLRTQGPVSLLVRGPVKVEGGGALNADGRASQFVVFSNGSQGAFFGGGARVLGLFYAPHAALLIAGNSQIGGHLFGKTVALSGTSNIVQSGETLPQLVASSGGKDKKLSLARTAMAGLGPDPAFRYHDHYAFPNPSRGTNPTIRVQVGMADSVQVQIYDAAGSMVHNDFFGVPRVLDDSNGKGDQYTYDYVWNVGRMGSGVYIYVITATKAGEKPIRKTGKAGVIR